MFKGGYILGGSGKLWECRIYSGEEGRYILEGRLNSGRDAYLREGADIGRVADV